MSDLTCSVATAPGTDFIASRLLILSGSDLQTERDYFIDRQTGAGGVFTTSVGIWRFKLAKGMLSISRYVTAYPLDPHLIAS